MKRCFKKYWVYVAIAIFGGILGTALSLTIWHQNNIGTLADWVSGIGSLGAIVFAYIQIKIQIKEGQLAKRPIFSIMCLYALNKDFENYYVNDQDFQLLDKALNSKEKESKEKKIKTLSNLRQGYKIENLSNESALNICFEIKYDDKKESDIMTISSINPKSNAVLFTHEMLSNKSENVYKDVHTKIEYIKLHFDSIIGVHYTQIWNQKSKISTPNGKENEYINMINYKIQETDTSPRLENTRKIHI